MGLLMFFRKSLFYWLLCGPVENTFIQLLVDIGHQRTKINNYLLFDMKQRKKLITQSYY